MHGFGGARHIAKERRSPNQCDVHVLYTKAGKVWRVEVTRNKRPSGSQATKSPAIIQARRLATRNTSELVVHNQDRKSASAAATATIRTRREASPAAE
jgi:hypothetical protein